MYHFVCNVVLYNWAVSVLFVLLKLGHMISTQQSIATDNAVRLADAFR